MILFFGKRITLSWLYDIKGMEPLRLHWAHANKDMFPDPSLGGVVNQAAGMDPCSAHCNRDEVEGRGCARGRAVRHKAQGRELSGANSTCEHREQALGPARVRIAHTVKLFCEQSNSLRDAILK